MPTQISARPRTYKIWLFSHFSFLENSSHSNCFNSQVLRHFWLICAFLGFHLNIFDFWISISTAILWFSVLLFHFDPVFLAGIFFSAIYMYIENWVFGKIAFQIYFFLTFLAGMIFSGYNTVTKITFYISKREKTKTK